MARLDIDKISSDKYQIENGLLHVVDEFEKAFP